MLPPKKQKPEMKTMSVYVPVELLDAAAALAKSEKDRFRSRNEVLTWWLTMGQRLTTKLSQQQRAIDETARELGGVEVDVAIAHLVKKGLDK